MTHRFSFGASLAFASLLVSAPVGAVSCVDLLEAVVPEDPKVAIDLRVKAVTSPDALAKLFFEVGEIGEANQAYVQTLASTLFKELGADGAQQLARNLLTSHRDVVQDAVMWALVHVRSGETNAKNLLAKFPKGSRDFARWTKTGKGIESNARFLDALGVAMADYKAFEHFSGQYIGPDTAAKFVEALQGLHDPSLAGRFMERFVDADRLTRQYLLKEASSLKVSEGGSSASIQIKGNQDMERNGAAKALRALVSRSPSELKQEAYFNHQSNGDGNRPKFKDPQVARDVGVQFLSRKKYDLEDFDVKFAGETLAQYPVADEKVDGALEKLLRTGAKVKPSMRQHTDIHYAILELSMLQRNAQGLSHFKIEPEYAHAILGNETRYLMYLRKLVELHANAGLEKVPALKRLAVDYFKRYPKALEDLDRLNHEAVQKLRGDFGL